MTTGTFTIAPPVIQAIQVTGDNFAEIEEFVTYPVADNGTEGVTVYPDSSGQQLAPVGRWVVNNVVQWGNNTIGPVLYSNYDGQMQDLTGTAPFTYDITGS